MTFITCFFWMFCYTYVTNQYYNYANIVTCLSNNMKYRSITQIVSSILDAVNGGATITKIMNNA